MHNTNKNMEWVKGRQQEQAKTEYYSDKFMVIIKI